MNADLHTIFSSGDCPSHEQLLAYFTGDLSGEERNRIEHHLMECEMCSDELGGLSKMKDIGKLPRIVAEIRSEIGSQPKKVIKLSPRILLTAAAASVALLIGVWFLLRILPSQDAEKLLVSQNKEVGKEMQAPVPPAPVKQPPAPLSTSSGKPLLAVNHPPKKIKASKEEEKTVTRMTDEVPAVEEPQPMPATENKTILVQHLDSVTQQKALGYASEIQVTNDDIKTLTMQPSSLAEEKKDSKGMVRQRAGTSSAGEAMSLYHEGNYQQASLLFELMLAADSSNSGTRYYLADCYYHLKDYSRAKKLCMKILSNPEDQYYIKAGELLRKVKSEE